MSTAGYTVAAQDAVWTALTADTAFTAFLGVTVSAPAPRVFDTLAPPGVDLVQADHETPWPYATIADASEVAWATHCRPNGVAFDGVLRVRVWVPGAGQRLALVGYNHVRRILHDAAFALGSGITLTTLVSLERTLTDPDGAATQAIARVDCATTIPTEAGI